MDPPRGGREAAFSPDPPALFLPAPKGVWLFVERICPRLLCCLVYSANVHELFLCVCDSAWQARIVDCNLSPSEPITSALRGRLNFVVVLFFSLLFFQEIKANARNKLIRFPSAWQFQASLMGPDRISAWTISRVFPTSTSTSLVPPSSTTWWKQETYLSN